MKLQRKHIVILVIILLLIFLLTRHKKSEGLDNTTPTLSNEAIQSISSLYSNTDGTVSFNNLRSTGKTTLKDVSANSLYSNSIGANDISGTNINSTNINGGKLKVTDISANTITTNTIINPTLVWSRESKIVGGAGGGGGAGYDFRCPPGTVMTGIVGSADANIKYIGIICT